MPSSPEFKALPLRRTVPIIISATAEWAWENVRYHTAVNLFELGARLTPSKRRFVNWIGWQIVGLALMAGRPFRADPQDNAQADT